MVDKVESFKLVIGREGLPGARIFRFDGRSDDEGKVEPGRGKITRAVLGGDKEVTVVEGQFRFTGIGGGDNMFLTLSGSCTSHPDAPAQEKFTAFASFRSGEAGDKIPEGKGNFDCGDQKTENVPARIEIG